MGTVTRIEEAQRKQADKVTQNMRRIQETLSPKWKHL